MKKLIFLTIFSLFLGKAQAQLWEDLYFFNAIEVQGGWQQGGFFNLGYNARWDIDPPGGGDFIHISMPGSQHSLNVNLGFSYGGQLREGAFQFLAGYNFYWVNWKRFEIPTFLVLGVQNQLITNFQRLDYRLVPELGLHLFGAFYVKYGYALPLLENPFEHVGPHRIAVGLSIPINY